MLALVGAVRDFEAFMAGQRRAHVDLDVLLDVLGGSAYAGAPASPQLIELARAHKLVPFVARASDRFVRVPEDIRRDLIAESRTAAMRSLAMAQRLLTLTTALDAAGVTALALKGPVLAELAFGDLGARTFLDLDLLVRPRDASRAASVLAALGLSPIESSPTWSTSALLETFGECSFVHPTWKLSVDLHTSATELGYSFSLPVEEAFEASAVVEIAGRSVRTFDPALTFAFICYHSSKHNWGALSFVAELAGLLRRYPLDADVLAPLAGRVGTRRMLAIGLVLASRIGGATLTPALAALAESGFDEAALEGTTLAASRWGDAQPHWLAKTRPRSLRTPVVRDDVYWRLLDARDKAILATHVLLRPGPKDWSVIDLPRPLRSLYVPLRLARLALRELGWQLNQGAES